MSNDGFRKVRTEQLLFFGQIIIPIQLSLVVLPEQAPEILQASMVRLKIS
jgi:hypothetical protein